MRDGITWRFITGFIALVGVYACSNAEDAMNDDARAYVAGLPDDCIYTDGYTCAEAAGGKSYFLNEIDGMGMVSAQFLKAWAASFDDFQAIEEFSDEQKKLKHYKIGFAREDGALIVVYRPLLLPYMVDGNAQGVSRETIGPGVKYWVDPDSFSVTKRLFQK